MAKEKDYTKKAERGKKRAANKAVRKGNKAKRIEARKGLAEGEGAKVLENRKTRRSELFKDPKGGKFTEKYEPNSVDNPVGTAQQEGIEKTEKDIKVGLGVTKPKQYGGDFFSSGGGFSASTPSEDRGSISGNASSAFMRKKGYM